MHNVSVGSRIQLMLRFTYKFRYYCLHPVKLEKKTRKPSFYRLITIARYNDIIYLTFYNYHHHLDSFSVIAVSLVDCLNFNFFSKGTEMVMLLLKSQNDVSVEINRFKELLFLFVPCFLKS